MRPQPLEAGVTPLRIVCERAVARGEIPAPPSAVVTRTAMATPLFDLMTTGQPLDDQFAVRFTDEVLLPLLERGGGGAD